MLKLILENVVMAIIGLLTGAFIGGLPLGHGLVGALIGGFTGAALLVLLTLLFHAKKWEKAKTILKYASIGILPGMFIGGSKPLSLGVNGAIIFGIISAIIYATIIYKMIESHQKSERYFVFTGHYLILFLLGSISVFVTILIVDFVGHLVDFEKLVLKMPVYLTTLLLIGGFLGIYFVGFLIKKRKLKTWSLAFKSTKKSLIILASILLAIMLSILLTRMEYISLNHFILAVTGVVIPYGVGLVLPLSFGYLLANNNNRPMMGSVFSLVGGILVMVIGISVAPMLLLPGSGLLWAGLITGMFMIMFSLFSMAKPDTHLFAGCSIIIFSILSFIGAAGGLIVGGLLGIVGGTLIAAWNGGSSKTMDDDPEVHKSPKDIPSVPSNTISG